jgi:hypothetical protein
MDLSWARYIVLITVAIYLAFSFFERKTVNDEREELIRLKTLELMQKLTMWTLIAVSLLLLVNPEVSAFYPVTALAVACMYGEIFGKIYYRRKF